MNDTMLPDNASASGWPSRDHRVRVPDTSMLPGSEQAPPVALGLLNSAAQGAHETIDRLADSATPAVKQLGDGVAAAGQVLRARTAQLREARDQRLADMRGTVRRHPLTAVAVAFAVGAAMARITR